MNRTFLVKIIHIFFSMVVFLSLFTSILGTRTALAENPMPVFMLPWEYPQSWYFTGGSHDWVTGDNTRSGLDFAPNGGRAVLAAAAGRVIYAGFNDWDHGNNLNIRIEHANGWQTWYLHLADRNVNVGDVVQQGGYIGNAGNSGADGIHLHIDLVYTGNGSVQHMNWGGRAINGWRVTSGTNYNGYIEKDGRRVYPEASPGTNQLVQSENRRTNNTTCPAPTLNTPTAGQVLSDRNVTFSWNGVNCGQGSTFRIKNVATMDSGGTTIIDTGKGGTSHSETIPEQWLNQDLYWGVRAANASGAQWAIRSFRIQPGGGTPGGDACAPSSDQATIYNDINYTGGCSRLNLGNYTDTGALNIANDAVSSVRVGGSVKLVLCRDGNYGGTCETFNGDDADLRDNQVGNDQASSGRVERRVTNDPCPSLALGSPADGATSANPTITFSWSAPGNCSFNGYTLRLKDSPDMERGGTIIFDEGVGATTVAKNIPAQWHGRDLYWGVRTANPLSTNWSIRRLRIEQPSEIDPQTVSSGQRIDAHIDPANEDDTFTFSATAGQAATITMNRTDISSLDSFIELFGPNGLVAVDDDGGGNFNSRLVKTLSESGNYRLVAHSYNRVSSGSYRIGIDLSAAPSGDGDDGRWLSYGTSLGGTISPNTDRDTYYFSGVAGRTISLRMNAQAAGLDSFIELYDSNGTKVGENDDGGGNYNSWLVASLTSGGTYRVVTRSYNGASSGSYTISINNFSGSNLAQDRSVYASSTEGNNASLTPAMTTDGNRATRWSSAFTDDQWIYVDLGQDKSINQVVLRWENAFADRYDVYVRGAGEANWRSVYQTTSGDGNVDTISFTPTTARYVMMMGRHRYAHYGWQQFGYSLWEFEVYNTLTALIPTVPPDNEEKIAEALVPLVPLPPEPAGKDAPILSAGAEQENTPPKADVIGDTPMIAPGETYGPPITGISLSAERVVQGEGQVTLTATDARDTDEQGNGIVAYRWMSEIDGMLGDQATITLSPWRLSVGLHIITLEVQDNEGSWSAPAQVLLDVQAAPEIQKEWHIYLPIGSR